jgi:hypothetical protein
MNKNIISPTEASLLLHKLFSERVSVVAFLISPASQLKLGLTGFIDSITELTGLVISPVRPASFKDGYLSIKLLGRDAEFVYSEVREIPEEERTQFDGAHGDSVLIIRFLDCKDLLALFFTV